MPVVQLTRKAGFCASHRLHSRGLTNEENSKVFGPCNRVNGHGHNYEVEVTVRGELDTKTGMVFSLADLKRTINEELVSRFDHKHLNLDVPEFKELNPTAENIAIVSWNLLEARLPSGILYKVKIQETANNSCEYFGEGR